MRPKFAGLAFILLLACVAFAQPATQPAKEAEQPVEAAPPSAPSHLSAVTVYQENAMVTREVEVKAGKGIIELIVTALPPRTVASSLYTEGTDGVRVLSTRFRSRAVRTDTRQEVRAKEEEIRGMQFDAQLMQRQTQVIEQNLQLLGKLENFTAAALTQLTEKGLLDADAPSQLTEFIMTSRSKLTNDQVDLQQQIQLKAEAVTFAQRELAELSAGTTRTEFDAVITVDKTAEAVGTVQLNYLVDSATWRPLYKLHAGEEKDPVQVEYLAAIQQQSGEDWTGVEITLSTAQPMLNAAPPELVSLDVSTGTPVEELTEQGLKQQRDASKELRKRANDEGNSNRQEAANNLYNDASAIDQTLELLAKTDAPAGAGAGWRRAEPVEGPTVTFHLRTKFSLPSRTDEQLIEVARIELQPEFFYKAVPVLTTHVYRLANLINKSDAILLPGEATMYLGGDFVGRMNVPLVAIGQQFTVGFGVDPQVQVDRQLVSKAQAVQGGNQVHNFEYRIRLSNFKDKPIKIEVWDRLPKAENESVNVTLLSTTPELSKDPEYLRVDHPKNLLRWDMTLDPNAHDEKAATINYSFKLEYDKKLSIGGFKATK